MNDSDLVQLRSLLASVANIEDHGIRTKDGEGRETTQENLAMYRQKASAIIAGLTDDQLLSAYQRTDGEPGNSEADALLAEIDRRGLNV